MRCWSRFYKYTASLQRCTERKGVTQSHFGVSVSVYSFKYLHLDSKPKREPHPPEQNGTDGAPNGSAVWTEGMLELLDLIGGYHA